MWSISLPEMPSRLWKRINSLTKSSNPNSVPVNSRSFLSTTWIREPIQRSINSTPRNQSAISMQFKFVVKMRRSDFPSLSHRDCSPTPNGNICEAIPSLDVVRVQSAICIYLTWSYHGINNQALLARTVTKYLRYIFSQKSGRNASRSMHEADRPQ